MSCIRDNNGKTSMMRIGFLTTMSVGSIMCLAAIPAVYLDLSGAGELIMGGAGMMSTSGFAKAIQSKYEAGQGIINQDSRGGS